MTRDGDPVSDPGTNTTQPETEKSLRPTRKWVAALISGGFTIGAHAFGSGGWDDTEWAEVMTLGAGLASSYFALNDETMGGVPMNEKKDAPNTGRSSA